MFFSDCFLPLANKLNAPFAYMSPGGSFPFANVAFGNRLPLSFVPLIILPLPDNMNFFQRVINVVAYHGLDAFVSWVYDPSAQAVAEEFFGPLPPLTETRKNVSMMLLNLVTSMVTPMPTMPGIVDAGGMHCVAPKPLPKVNTIP
jgi:hypothetical protein